MVIYSLHKKRLYQRILWACFAFAIVFVGAYYSGFLRENCGTDVGCFLERAHECKPTDVTVLRDTTIYEYSVRSQIRDCSVHVTLQRVAEGTSQDLDALVGKKMICTIPKEEMQGFTVDSFERYFSSCHGELKEGLLELVLNRVYQNLVGQLGNALEELT